MKIIMHRKHDMLAFAFNAMHAYASIRCSKHLEMAKVVSIWRIKTYATIFVMWKNMVNLEKQCRQKVVSFTMSNKFFHTPNSSLQLPHLVHMIHEFFIHDL